MSVYGVTAALYVRQIACDSENFQLGVAERAKK